jgi:molecular chaperone IbpA
VLFVTILLPGGSGYAHCRFFAPVSVGHRIRPAIRPRRSRPARGEESYPPYNTERLNENSFQISVALAGFKPDEVELTVEQNVLTLEGRKNDKEGKTFLHRGISARDFKRQFTLADHVEVRGARFENGLLIIDLQREIPEAMKPRRIAINGATPSNVTQIESPAA